VIEHDAEHCVIEFTYKGESRARRPYIDVRRSERGPGEGALRRRRGWAHPKNMLFARAMSNGVKWYAPDLTGGIAVYTEGDEFVDSTAVDIGAGEGTGLSLAGRACRRSRSRASRRC
jgi:hypothetical protein